MKDHEYYQELISRLADEELTPREQTELDAHLKQCPECREFQQFCTGLQKINWVMQAPVEFTARVMTPIKRRKSIARWTLRSVGALAACVALFFGIRYTLGRTYNKMNNSASDPMMAMSQSFPAESNSSAVETAEEYVTAGGAIASEESGFESVNTQAGEISTAENTEFDVEEAYDEAELDAPMSGWDTTASDNGAVGGVASYSAKISPDLFLSGTLEIHDGDAAFFPEDESLLPEEMKQEHCYRLAGEMPPDGIYKGIFHLEKSFVEDGNMILMISIEGELEIAD